MEISELAPLVLIDCKNVKKDLTKDQKTNEIMQEVIDPLSIEDLKEKKTLNGIKADIQDSSWIQTEKNATSEIEDRIANKKGRFPCKYCNQTFSKSIYAISHE